MKLALFGMIFQQAISFISGLVIARVIGATEYGVFSLARSIQQIFGLFSRLGLDVGLQRFMGEAGTDLKSRGDKLSMIGRFRLLAFACSLIPRLLVALGFGSQIEEHLYRYEQFSAILLVTFIATPFLTDIAVLGGVYRGTFNPAPAVVAEYIILPSIRLLTILVLFASGFRLWGVVVGSSLAATIASLFLAVKFRRYLSSFPPHEEPIVKTGIVCTTLRYSAVIAFAMSVTLLTRSVDSFFLGYYTSAEVVGQYALVQMMLILIGLFGAALGQTLGAQIAARYAVGDRAGIEVLLERNVRLIALVSCPLFAVFFFWGTDLVQVFGPSYQLPSAVVRWLAAGALLVTLTACAGFALSMTGRHTLELKILFVGLVASVVLCAILVPWLGQLGAAVAVFLSLALVNLVRLYVVWRNLNVFHLRWPHMRTFVLALALAFPLSFTVGGEGLERILRAAGGAFVYLLFYAAVSWLLIDKDERESIRQILTKRFKRT
jgi:O-antigen/teichoic acid export membrane protein